MQAPLNPTATSCYCTLEINIILCSLFTHADKQGVDISVTVCVFVCFLYGYNFSTEDKASGVKFCTPVHRRPRQGQQIFVNFAPPKAQNQMNRSARLLCVCFFSYGFLRRG